MSLYDIYPGKNVQARNVEVTGGSDKFRAGTSRLLSSSSTTLEAAGLERMTTATVTTDAGREQKIVGRLSPWTTYSDSSSHTAAAVHIS